MIKQAQLGKWWNTRTVGTSAGATTTQAADTEAFHHIVAVTFYTDTDSILTIKDGSTVVWEGYIDVSVDGLMKHVTFPHGCLRGTMGNAVSALIASSTSDCSVTMIGYTRGE